MFDKWISFDGSTSFDNPFTLTMPGNDLEATATYKPIPIIEYELTVTGGNGNGRYPMGEVVTITADIAGPGEMFDKWISFDGSTSFDNPFTLTMPGNDLEATATYKPIPIIEYELTVTGGNGNGRYPKGEVVTITADSAGPGEIFDKWISSDGSTSFDNPFTLTMPGNDVEVTATYKPIPIIDYELTVTGGNGNGRYRAGEVVTITADSAGP